MSVPPIPPSFEQLMRRPFAFYPAILGVEYNEWLFKKATWSELLVANPKTGAEIWIPRRFLGEITSIDEPVPIVGLLKELEYKAGTVWPYERRVLPMPSAGEAPPPVPDGPRVVPPPSDYRRPVSPESRIGRLIVTALASGIVLCFLVVFFYRASPLRSRVVFTSKDQDFLGLSRTDDYFAVVSKLGSPAEDRWRPNVGELQYRALFYPQRAYSVILMGTDRDHLRYIGAVDRNWHVVHYVDLPGGGNTGSMLRELPKF